MVSYLDTANSDLQEKNKDHEADFDIGSGGIFGISFV